AKVKGAQVFYHNSSGNGKLLAESVQESLRSRVDGSNHRQAKENDSYYILRTTEIPAVIVECGFLSNHEEEKLLNDEGYQEKLAWAIYCGILDYFKNLDKI
ncbi:MAG: N-acetylmuramoyl-L-alanine amidase, partial [Anaerotignum sp.]|nr:N-acetylmuramoyl-L-alanine amidase [Anaerotignum sp.]